MDTIPYVSNFFNPIVEILVVEKLIDYHKPPRVYVSLNFALFLKVGDVLFFPDITEDLPKWIIKWEDYEQLFDYAITLTQRNILEDRIQFYAERS